MNARIFFWSLTSALAGFLFGFDTVVISGAEKTIQALWGLSPGLHGIAMASALYGTVVGSLVGGWPADRFGRKATLLWIGIAGYYCDAETGMVYVRARSNAPAKGRWMSKDPFSVLIALLRQFVYSHNNPATAIDPSGLQSKPPGQFGSGGSNPVGPLLIPPGPGGTTDKISSGVKLGAIFEAVVWAMLLFFS